MLELVPALRAPRSIIVHELSDLAAIFTPEIAVAVCSRAPLEGVDAYLATVVLAEERVLRARVTSSLPDLEEVFPERPGFERARATMRGEIAFLAELYRDLFDADELGLRFTSTSRATCPRFHVDRIGVRMTCTYGGPGTEWIDDPHVDRAKLGHAAGGLPDDTSGILRPGAIVQRMKPFDVGLLKGEAWPGNEGRGAVHRSPLPPPETRRLLVTVDAL